MHLDRIVYFWIIYFHVHNIETTVSPSLELPYNTEYSSDEVN